MAVVLIFLAGTVIAGALAMLGLPHGTPAWLLDLVSSWLLLGVLLTLYAAVRAQGPRGARAGAAVVAGLLAVFFASPKLERAGAGDALVVASSNIHLDTTDLSPLARWLAETKADLVMLQEVSPAAAESIAQWKDWPHRIILPSASPFGIAILSRHPLQPQEVPTDARQTPVIRVKLQWADGVLVSAVHPMPPLSASYHGLRDDLLVREARWLSENGGGVLAGDLNATPWSSALHRASDAGLRRAGGWAPTWPGYPMFGIAVDHVLATKDWCVGSFQTGPRIGSDHLPVAATLRRCG